MCGSQQWKTTSDRFFVSLFVRPSGNTNNWVLWTEYRRLSPWSLARLEDGYTKSNPQWTTRTSIQLTTAAVARAARTCSATAAATQWSVTVTWQFANYSPISPHVAAPLKRCKLHCTILFHTILSTNCSNAFHRCANYITKLCSDKMRYWFFPRLCNVSSIYLIVQTI